jgi:flagellar basal-body rod protein FlgB
MLDKISGALSTQGTALQLRARRQETIASNIANADTPNYKAVDFNFKDALQGALSKSSQTAAGSMAQTRQGHFGGQGGGVSSLDLATRYRVGSKAALDNNSVDMDVERANFADNTLKYEAASRALSGTIKTMQSAISGT